MSSNLTLAQATIGIVTALPKELAAARAVFSPCVSVTSPSGIVYELCAVPCIDGDVVVAMTLLPAMGNNFAASIATRMLSDCENVGDVMMVGIAGAIPYPSDPEKHVRLGDIVVSGLQGVFQFDLGKQESGSSFQHGSVSTPPSAKLWNAVNRLCSYQEGGERAWEEHIAAATARLAGFDRPPADLDVLDDGDGVVDHPRDPNRRDGFPRLFVGAVGSSNTLLKDAAKRDSISRAVPGLLCCVEMEGAGVQDATWVDNNAAGYLVIRGTCDYCNAKKNDTWQKYAALIAAAFARAVVEVLPAPSSSNSEASPPSSGTPVQRQSFGQISSGGDLTFLNINAHEVHIHVDSSGIALPHGMAFSAPLSGSGAPLRVLELQLTDATMQSVRRTESKVRQALGVCDYKRADRAADTLESLIATPPERLANPGMRTAALLAIRAHLNMAETSLPDAPSCVTRARRLIALVESKSGPDESACLAELAALKASLECIDSGPGAALQMLGDRTDPYAIRTRTALLLNQQKLTDALQIIEGRDPHERWCDVAVTVYALNDRVDEAQNIVRWAAGLVDRSRYPQCVVRMAQALMTRALADHTDGRNILPHTITAAEREKLGVVVKTLRPVLESVRAAGKPVSGLDMAALTLAWQANHLLQRREAVVEWLKLMVQWGPVPVDVARGVVSGYIEAAPDLPDRLRADHPDDFGANILAAVIQSGSLGKHTAAFEKAKELVPLADTDERKEELFRLCQQIWQELEGADAMECEAVARSLVEHNAGLHAIFEASVSLRDGNPDQAIEILETQKRKDDPYWLQMRANAELSKRNPGGAVEFLLRAAKQTFDAGLLQKAGDIAYLAKNFAVATWCYERLAELQPENLPAHGNLAHIYTFVLHDRARALDHFRALHAGEPGNKVHILNLAVCLAEAFHPQESLAMYDELCGGDEPPLQAVLGRAQLHHSLGHPETSLACLEPFRDRFWGEPQFVLAYMSTAYAAGSDAAALDAMKALSELRKKGGVAPEVFEAVPKDQALDRLKDSFRKTQQRNEHLHTEMLKGRMPWVWAEQVSNNAIYWGWRTRTQEMDWIGDEPVNRAQFCIYATNGFHPGDSEFGKSLLLPLKCPPAGTKIVADISALITLDRLGLLAAMAEHFGAVLVPAGYLPSVLEDSRQMVLNQRSQQVRAEQIVKQVQADCIQVLEDASALAPPMPIVDEYEETDEHRYGLADLVSPMQSAGILSEAQYAAISRISAKPPAVDDAHPALEQHQEIMVNVATLETVARVGLLDTLAGFYQIRIAAQEHRGILQRLDSIAYQAETREWHLNMWRRLRADPRFRFVPHSVPEDMRGKDRDDKDCLPFLASFVAQESRVPLLVDDRACQAFTFNELADVPHAAFGTNAVTSALVDAGTLNAEESAAVMRKLMLWRYRFIVPPPEILKSLADQYRAHLPGVVLREVAAYVHDCMRDPGLFAGPEKTDMGDSMALRLYLTWTSTVAQFLILVWGDEGFDPEPAARLTTWSCEELLPSLPRAVDGRTKARVGEKAAQIFLGDVLLNMVNRIGEPRMADAMKAIKEGLRLTDDGYQRIVMGVLNDTARTAPDS